MSLVHRLVSCIMAEQRPSNSKAIKYDGVDVVKDKDRYFLNDEDNSRKKFSDYVINSENRLSENFLNKVIEYRNQLLDILMKMVKEKEKAMLKEDITVYTGISGIAMLYLKIAKEGGNSSHLKQTALRYLGIACNNEKFKSKLLSRPTFLCGLSGPLVLRAIAIENIDVEGDLNEISSEKCIDILLQIFPAAIAKDEELPNELLYGRAGYLYALLLAKKYNEKSITKKITDEHIKKVALAIVENGVKYAKKSRRQVPMWWEWHEKEYLGAAHGICGILFILITAKSFIPDGILEDYVKPTLDYLIQFQYPSGNFPSSISGHAPPTNDKLLHWCHGAPGAIHLLLKAHECWPNCSDYLTRAHRCGEAIWERGLLKKGYGLCHGVAGNAYAFIALWNVTKMPQYLYKSAIFAEWCFNYGKRGCRVPDRPLSLFEGLAGPIYLLTDLIQNPSLASFPAFCDI